MKNSRTVRVVSYVLGNIGVVMWSLIVVLDGASLEKGVVVLIVSCGLMNLLLWNLLRLRKSRDQRPGTQ